MTEIEDAQVVEEVINEESSSSLPTVDEIKHQQDVENTKQALLASIRAKNPKLYWKLIHPEGYQPWHREDYKNSDIKICTEKGDKNIPFKRKVYRNELCSCGSKKKIKNCCGVKTYYTIPKMKQND